MEPLTEIASVLERAETATRARLAKEASAGNYKVVVPILDIAQKLALMRSNLTAGEPRETEEEDRGAGQPTPKLSAARARSVHTGEYPTFRREGDWLVKVGWSKKEQQTYEHKAPKAVVFSVAKALSRYDGKATFGMQSVLPCRNGDGTEVPSYQVYMTVAWLSSMGALQREGRSEYRAAKGDLEVAQLERLWLSTPDRSETGR